MKMQFRVDYEGGKSEVISASPLAWIGWEKWSGRRLSDMSSEGGGVGMGDMCRLSWEQTRLEHKTDLGFEDWVATLEDIEAVDGEEGKDPTSGDAEA